MIARSQRVICFPEFESREREPEVPSPESVDLVRLETLVSCGQRRCSRSEAIISCAKLMVFRCCTNCGHGFPCFGLGFFRVGPVAFLVTHIVQNSSSKLHVPDRKCFWAVEDTKGNEHTMQRICIPLIFRFHDFHPRRLHEVRLGWSDYWPLVSDVLPLKALHGYCADLRIDLLRENQPEFPLVGRDLRKCVDSARVVQGDQTTNESARGNGKQRVNSLRCVCWAPALSGLPGWLIQQQRQKRLKSARITEFEKGRTRQRWIERLVWIWFEWIKVLWGKSRVKPNCLLIGSQKHTHISK